ncbi:MAG: DUF4079 family protein [Myxococcales bacterium]|nr:DUF4079 family protein [Myxococcales bacterium]
MAYVHPLWMLASLGLAGVAWRAGMHLRAVRRRRTRPRPGDRARHLRVAKPAVALIGIGFVAGPVSMVFLRGSAAFTTAHAAVAAVALMSFVATAVLGRRLERGTQSAREAHAIVGTLALLAAIAALGTGFVLLP